ncbi:MAG: hypothetical protein ACYS9T_03475 [Planctomycetota bacterium]
MGKPERKAANKMRKYQEKLYKNICFSPKIFILVINIPAPGDGIDRAETCNFVTFFASGASLIRLYSRNGVTSSVSWLAGGN